mmetsp:Transcript_24216/g.43048  ORF Transcript_24216/g.43048 Transcript_24216/m.43048 type:complete len:83 (-) Transcript_24216:2375-2623(-)
MSVLFPSFVSGVCAAGAGVIGKFAFAPYERLENFEVVLRVVAFVAMLVLNALMLQFFVKSIATLGASRATMANFTSNFLNSV